MFLEYFKDQFTYIVTTILFDCQNLKNNEFYNYLFPVSSVLIGKVPVPVPVPVVPVIVPTGNGDNGTCPAVPVFCWAARMELIN